MSHFCRSCHGILIYTFLVYTVVPNRLLHCSLQTVTIFNNTAPKLYIEPLVCVHVLSLRVTQRDEIKHLKM